MLRKLMSEYLLFAKIAEPEMTAINFNDHLQDRRGEVERGLIEVFPKLWNLRPFDRTNGEITRIPRFVASYQKLKEETKNCGDYRTLPEETPEYRLIRRMLLGADSVVQTPNLRAFETNNRRMERLTRASWAETLLCCNTRSLYTRMSRRGDE